MAIERFLGGGKLFVKTGTNTALEIGDMQDFTINKKTETKKAFNYDNGYEDVAQEMLTKLEYTFKFSSNNFYVENLKLAFGGADLAPTDKTALSTAIVAGAGGTAPTITGGFKATSSLNIINCAMTYVCKNLATGKTDYWQFGNASLQVDGDLALLSKDAAKLSFNGTLYSDSNGNYFYKGTTA